MMIVEREKMIKSSVDHPTAAPSAAAPSADAPILPGSYAAAAAAAMAGAMSGAFPFPFGSLGGLGGLRMLSGNQPPFPGMLMRPSLASLGSLTLPFASRPSYVFPYAAPPTVFNNQQQQMIQRQQQLHHQQQQQQQQLQANQAAAAPCGGAGGTSGSGAPAAAGLPHTPPTSPSLDDNSDLNKTGTF